MCWYFWLVRFALFAILIPFLACSSHHPARVHPINPPQLYEFRNIDIDWQNRTAKCVAIAELRNAKSHSKVIVCRSPWDAGQLGLPPKR